MKRTAVLLASIAFAMLLVSGVTRLPSEDFAETEVSAQTLQKANIVLVLLDDLDRYTMEHFMPRTERLVKDKGISFEKATYSTPLCCPSRASLQRGQYPHNTFVKKNNPPEGGFETFREGRLQNSTYGTWLHDAGYQTGYFGKYMNGYENYQGKKRGYRPPGWDRWFAAAAEPTKHLYNSDGYIVQTKRMRRMTFDATVAKFGLKWIDAASGRSAPFIASLNFYAPHYPAEHPRSLDKMYRTERLPNDPSFSEADVTDKPRWVRNLDNVVPVERAALTSFHRDRLRSVEFVDRKVAQLVSMLAARGVLADTYIVVWADNGFHLGQHRLPSQTNGGKLTPYTHDVELPIWVRGPGIEPGTRSGALVSNVDIAPTFAEMAGVQVPPFVDGRSFLGLARGQRVPYREFTYLQGNSSTESSTPNWREIRTQTEAYHYYPVTGEEELYDLENDPYQLDNILATSTVDTGRYRDLIRRMGNCQGQECRNTEGADPE